MRLKRKSTVNYPREHEKKYRSETSSDESQPRTRGSVLISRFRSEEELSADGESSTPVSTTNSSATPIAQEPEGLKLDFISWRTYSVLTLLGITASPRRIRDFMDNQLTQPLFTNDQSNLILRAADFFVYGWREASFVLYLMLAFEQSHLEQQSDATFRLLRSCINNARIEGDLEIVCNLIIQQLRRLADTPTNKLKRFLLRLILMRANSSLVHIDQYEAQVGMASQIFYDLGDFCSYLQKSPRESLQLDCSGFILVDSYFRNHEQLRAKIRKMLPDIMAPDAPVGMLLDHAHYRELNCFTRDFLHSKPTGASFDRVEILNQCIRECLTWCLTKLEGSSRLKGVSSLSNQSSYLRESSEAFCIYWTLCTQLERDNGTIKCPWHSWWLPSRATVIDISLFAFLAKITSLMLEASHPDAASSSYYRRFTSKSFRLLNRAIDGARALTELGQEDLAARFLWHQDQKYQDDGSFQSVGVSIFNELWSTPTTQSLEPKPRCVSLLSTLAPSLSSSSFSDMRLSVVPLARRLSFSGMSRASGRSGRSSNVDRLSDSMNAFKLSGE
jgi:hypothetical protein